MIRFVILYLALFLFQLNENIFAQKKDIPDSTKIRLEQSLDSILFGLPDKLKTEIFKKKLNQIIKSKKKAEQIGWKSKGKFSMFFNQTAFSSDWQGGGTTNIAGNAVFNYECNYKKKSLTWDNKIFGDYGLTSIKGEDFFRKTSDRIEINSRLGQRIGESLWNYSLFVNFTTQFAKGYQFSEDPDTGETIRQEETRFLSPAFIQTGPGFLWKKNDDFTINLAPITSRIIIVDDRFTTTTDYISGSYFGVETGEKSRYEFGGSVVIQANFETVKNVTVDNNLALYVNYIEDPYNIDINYTLNINLIVNKYITGSFTFQAIYDDNAASGFQVREVLGLGLNYDF